MDAQGKMITTGQRVFAFVVTVLWLITMTLLITVPNTM
jgi:hypothetical protein